MLDRAPMMNEDEAAYAVGWPLGQTFDQLQNSKTKQKQSICCILGAAAGYYENKVF